MSIFTEELLVLDYIVLIFSCVLVIFSFWKGFVSSILGLLTWVGSIFITIYTYSFLSEFFYNLLLNIDFLSDFKQFVSTISFIISVPLDSCNRLDPSFPNEIDITIKSAKKGLI